MTKTKCIFYPKSQNPHIYTLKQYLNVKLLDSPFLQAQQTDLHYILALDPDRLLAPFLREAGLQPKAPSYTNWENTGLDGHIGGHYLSALSMMYAATGDTAVYNRLNYMLNELNRAQQTVGTGFIGGTPGSLQLWKDIKADIKSRRDFRAVTTFTIDPTDAKDFDDALSIRKLPIS